MALDTEAVKSGVDVLAVSTTASALMGWLPPLAALATLVWTSIRIYETQTIRSFLKKDENEDNTQFTFSIVYKWLCYDS